MADSRITDSIVHIKLDQAKWHRLEALSCQASGLAHLFIANDLLDYKAEDPMHRTLWLLMDLVIKTENIRCKMIR